MPLLLLLAGVLAIGAGGAMLAVPLTNPALRSPEAFLPLMMPGIVAVIGGFVLIGLASIGWRLHRIRKAIETQTLAHAPVQLSDSAMTMPTVTAPAAPVPTATPREQERAPIPPPHPVAVPAEEVRAVQPPAPSVPPPVVAPAPIVVSPPNDPQQSPANRAASSVASPVAPEPIVRTADPAPPPAPEWPRIDGADRLPRADTSPSRNAEPPALPAVAPAPLAPPEVQPVSRVLKSGVIEGMAYTLYSDGSVDAEMAQGTVHFASIAEWRSHLRVGA